MNEPTTGHRDLVTAALAAIALTLFARLALRHVGESYFLADQVDVLQKFEALLRLEPEGLWGSQMSGTSARALGPFGAIAFGLPVAFGFGIDGIHAFTSLFLAVAAGLAFWQLARLDSTLAWVWLIVFTAMRMVWWNAAMFWVNTVLLPLGLLLLALAAAMLRRPSLPLLAGMTGVLLLALQEHLVALVGVPVLLIATVVFLRGRGERDAGPASRGPAYDARVGACFAVVVLVGLLPYAIAEGQTGWQNTRAMFSHVDTAVRSSGVDGRRAAVETLVLAMDPMAIWPDSTVMPIVAGAALAAGALLVIFVIRRRPSDEEQRRLRSLAWLVTCTCVGVAGQALFYLMMGRPLNGLHYAMLLAPWYAIPPAALLSAVLPTRGTAGTTVAATLGAIAIALLVLRAPGLADRYAERTPWNYQAIVTALDALCSGQGVDTVEGAGFRNELTPGYDSVLRYLMKRGYTRCRYEGGSSVLVAADRSGRFDESVDIGGRQFTREEVVAPGLARYRAR